MKLKQIKPKPKMIASFLGICIVFLLWACGGGSSSSDAGSISFNLEWQQAPSQSQAGAARFKPSADVCTDNGISEIRATVENSSSTVVASGSWACTAYQGTLSSVPAGSGMTLTVVGYVGGSGDWQGQVTGITVVADQITNAGTIVMTPVSPGTLIWGETNWGEGVWD